MGHALEPVDATGSLAHSVILRPGVGAVSTRLMKSKEILYH